VSTDSKEHYPVEHVALPRCAEPERGQSVVIVTNADNGVTDVNIWFRRQLEDAYYCSAGPERGAMVESWESLMHPGVVRIFERGERKPLEWS
jgi:hypothetical protein